ncbi:MAG TPA: FIST N-terminal domain-containing protein [Planctomycetota bacterium]|nr:FIST N-terminal domain-containing protein [Planctomycetota bacterium]
MTTRMSVGHSASGDGQALGKQAASEAREKLGSDALLGIVFVTSKTDLGGVTKGVKSVLGQTPVIGCSSAGEFVTDRVSAGGLAIALIASDEMGIAVGMGEGLRANTPRAVQQLSAEFKKTRKPAPAGATQKTIFMLSDGLAGNGEGLVDALAMEAGGGVTIAGGAAGDDALFKETFVFLNDQIRKDAVVAAEITSKKKIGVGVFHGWCAASAPGTVTKAEGGKLVAIDGKPAIDFYRAYAKKLGVELTKENQNAFVFTHELGIVLMNNELKVRAPLSVNDDGSINCATEVPEGKQVRIVEGDHGAIIAAAKTAAENAMQGLGGGPAAGAIVFDCVARKLVLDQKFKQEVDAFRDVVKAPVMGFNTYGEIARVRGQLSGFHNTTAVVAAVPT